MGATRQNRGCTSVIGHASAIVQPGRLRHIASNPPLTLRQVYDEDGVGLCLVGSAAGPLAGDELYLDLDVEAGARTTLTAAGATIAQGGASSTRVRASVGAGASLRADPGPLVVCAGASVHVELTIDLDPTGCAEWRELLVLGRSGEPPGAATLDWNVTRGGTPLLRQRVDLADAALRDWDGMLHGRRVLATTLRVGPAIDARTVVRSATSVTQRLAEHAELSTELSEATALGRM